MKMASHGGSLWPFLALFLLAFSGNAKPEFRQTITVDSSGNADFTTIQSAIDSVPPNSTTWTCVDIRKGVYREQIKIPYDKPFIYLRGGGITKTYVVWDGHDSTATSATFMSQANSTFAESITFVNSYNSGKKNNMIRPAVAAMIEGDKSAFHRCKFVGLQDTLWDVSGRHYFKHCTIKGAIDFIFGNGQSIYESCSISVVGEVLNGGIGYITAQGRGNEHETTGFIFKQCKIIGKGKVFLGRPWRDYARVLYYNTSMSQVVVPQGWDSWLCIGHEDKLTFAEHECYGAGSNTSGRVKWEKRLSSDMLKQLTSRSFVDSDEWMSGLPFKLLAD